MATIRELTDMILIKADKAYDHTIRQVIKERIFQLRSLMIRRSVQRNGLDEELKMSIDIPLTKVESTDSCFSNYHCTVMKTSIKVPTPVRLSRGLPFDFVGTMTGIPYSFTRYTEHQIFSYIPIRKDMRSYIINNGYIYLVNPMNEKFVRIRHVFENIDEIVNLCDPDCIDDNTDIFLPGDLTGEIVTILTMELLNNPRYKELEIPINDDKRFANS